MRFPSSTRSRGALLAAMLGAVVLAMSLPAVGAETSNSEFVIIPDEDVFPDDLYAGAIRVVVDGTLDGDLIAFAAEEVVINGTVTGSVTAITPRLEVNGDVEGSVRMAGNTLSITGTVGRDVVAPVITAELGPDSIVEGDVLLWAWNARLEGSVGLDVTGSQRNLELAGAIEGDVDVSVHQLTVTGDLVVGGDLGYRSDNDARGLEMASVDGAVVHKNPLPPNLRVRALTLLGRFMVILFLSIAALTTAYGWPDRTSRAIAMVGRRPLRSWGKGAVLVFSPLLVIGATILMVSVAPAAAAFPLLAVLVPVILALFGLVAALGLVAGAPVVGWLGGAVFRRLELYGAILVGSLMVGLAWYLPVVGWLVPIVVLPLGLGAWMASFTQSSSAVSSSVSEAR
jgi:cytoskeletal protein CcmA (bactofilin family)